MIENADLILFVVDGARELEEEDLKIHDAIQADKVIGIINKIDMEKADISKLTSNKMDRDIC